MTKRDCIKATISGSTIDITPYYIDLTYAGSIKVAEYYDIDINSVQKHIGNYMLFLKYTEPEDFVPESLDGNLYKDEFGVIWDEEKCNEAGDWGFVAHPVKDMDISSYVFPTGKGGGRFKTTDKIVADNPECFNLLQMSGFFDISWRIIGLQDMYTSLASDESFTNTILDKALEYNLNIIDQLPKYVDGVRFIEDWGDQRCITMGYDNWRMFIKPRLKIMYESCKNKDFDVFVHSCGNITKLLPDLIELGADVVDPIQPEVMDVDFIKKEYGKDIVLFGGLGCQSTLPLNTPEMVIKESRQRLDSLSENGKYIFGPAGAIPTETPIENIVALIEFCRNKYKLGK